MIGAGLFRNFIAQINDVKAAVLAQLAASSGSSLVGFLQDGVAAVARTLQAKVRERVSFRDFGAVGDGVTDDTAAVQAALDFWRTWDGPLRLESGGGNFRTTQPLTVTWTASDTWPKVIDLEGGRITSDLAAAGDGLAFIVQSSVGGTFVQNKKFRNIAVWANTASVSYCIRFNGGNNSGGSTGYLYACEFHNLTAGLNAGGGHGVVFQDNVFESQARGLNARNSANATGYPVLFEQTAGSTGIISSFNVHGANTDGGLVGLFVKSPVADVNLQGVTAIRAQREGISVENWLGGTIRDIHVENNWQSAADQASGGAGIKVAGRGRIENVYGVNGGTGKQKYALNVFISSGKTVEVSGGFSSGLVNYAYVQGADTTSTYIHDGNYDVVYAAQIRDINKRNGVGRFIRKTIQDFVNPAVVTPNPDLGSNVYVFMGQNVTINTPAGVPTVGDELEFCFEQNGSGGYTVTWSSDYGVNWTPNTGFGKKNTISFRYLKSSNINSRATGRWVQVAANVNV